MVEDKKTDDYTIEMDKIDQGNKNFEAAAAPPQPRSPPSNQLASSPALPVLAYCGSSILMTVMNKYVLSGLDFNLNFFLLLVQVMLTDPVGASWCSAVEAKLTVACLSLWFVSSQFKRANLAA